MTLKLSVLAPEMIQKIIDEGMQLIFNPGIRVHNAEALKLLADAGADVNFSSQIVHIPEKLAHDALVTTPSEFSLYNLQGSVAVHYGGDRVQFDPGSAGIAILDSQTQKHRKPLTADLVKFIKLVEMLPQIDAQSTSFICQDVVEEIGDLYRLYLALLYIKKPIITGAFRTDTWWVMKELLSVAAGGEEKLAAQPIAVFDVCPSPPLLWSNLTCQNLIDCARASIPAELVSMPLTGATAPVTLAAAVVQHTAENLSGVIIHQLAKPGSPIVWGGSPSAFDMREGTTPMGDVCTWLIDCAYAQVGKTLNIPTHAYLGMSDAKIIDAQCGAESMGGTMMAALAGINMVSGAGMIDFESCLSFEKLVIDAEIIGMTRRLIAGITLRDDPIATIIIEKMGHKSDYLGLPHTMKWYGAELYRPSSIIDRSTLDGWEKKGSKSTFERARDSVQQLLAKYQPPEVPVEQLAELRNITERAAHEFGMDHLPDLPVE